MVQTEEVKKNISFNVIRNDFERVILRIASPVTIITAATNRNSADPLVTVMKAYIVGTTMAMARNISTLPKRFAIP